MADASAALPRATGRRAARVARTALGVAAGTATALAVAVALATAALIVALGAPLPVTRRPARRAGLAGLTRLARLERRRVHALLDPAPATDGHPSSGARLVGHLAARVPLGLLGGLVLALIGWGAVTGTAMVAGWLTGAAPDGIRPTPAIVAYLTLAALVLAFLAVQGVAGVAALDRRLLRWACAPSRTAMRHRIAQLSASRAEVVAAVDEERRRIERDLHDGLQQRLVALGMLVGRARRAHDPARADELLAAAHAESRHALDELREVTWRVYPAALHSAGLADAVETVAERAGLPVDLSCRLAAEPPAPIGTAAYFVVCEAVGNAAKHSGATRVDVALAGDGERLTVRVRDDGRGGARAAGGGLSGLARRVAAVDGRFAVHSPDGGPTLVEAELPCG